MVFQGGCKALARVDAPIIMFEANVYNARGFGLTVEEAKNYLASLTLPRFDFFEIQEGRGLVRIEKQHPVHSNILAVPRSKSDRLSDLSVISPASQSTKHQKRLTDS